jgi:hypothetical protein
MKLMKAYKLTHVAYEFICLKSFSITLLTLLLDLTSGGEFSSADQQLFENGDSSCFLVWRSFRQAQAMDFD